MKLGIFFIVLVSLYLVTGENGCGRDWSTADKTCKNKGCSSDQDCSSSGEHCYAGVASCAGSTPTAPSAPSAPSGGTPSGSSGCKGSHSVTNSDLQKIMESSQDFSRFVQPLNNALKRYSMTCPQRIAVFLSQVRHETAGLTVFFQSIDNGGGTLHMTPSNWPIACAAIPELKTAFGGSCDSASRYAASPSSAETSAAAQRVFSDATVAFLSGAWWFAEGAKNPQIFGWKGCGDLRLDADVGEGSTSGTDCHYTGNVQVSCCIFWTIGGSAGLTQRQNFYRVAKSVADSWGTSNEEATPESVLESVSQSSTDNGTLLIAICVVSGVIILVLLAIIFVMSRRMSRVESV